MISTKNKSALFSILTSPKETWYQKFEILLNLGLSVNARADNDELLLASIIIDPNTPPEVMTLLLRHGADLSLKPRKDGKTLLERAQAFAAPEVRRAINEFIAEKK